MLLKLILCAVLVESALAVIPDYVPDELKEYINSLHDICFPKHGVTQAEVDSYQLSDNSPKMMCYIKCMLEGANWIKSDGTIDTDVLTGRLESFDNMKVILESIKKCADVPAGNHECEKAYNFNVCVQQADPEHYFTP